MKFLFLFLVWFGSFYIYWVNFLAVKLANFLLKILDMTPKTFNVRIRTATNIDSSHIIDKWVFKSLLLSIYLILDCTRQAPVFFLSFVLAMWDIIWTISKLSGNVATTCVTIVNVRLVFLRRQWTIAQTTGPRWLLFIWSMKCEMNSSHMQHGDLTHSTFLLFRPVVTVHWQCDEKIDGASDITSHNFSWSWHKPCTNSFRHPNLFWLCFQLSLSTIKLAS